MYFCIGKGGYYGCSTMIDIGNSRSRGGIWTDTLETVNPIRPFSLVEIATNFRLLKLPQMELQFKVKVGLYVPV